MAHNSIFTSLNFTIVRHQRTIRRLRTQITQDFRRLHISLMQRRLLSTLIPHLRQLTRQRPSVNIGRVSTFSHFFQIFNSNSTHTTFFNRHFTLISRVLVQPRHFQHTSTRIRTRFNTSRRRQVTRIMTHVTRMNMTSIVRQFITIFTRNRRINSRLHQIRFDNRTIRCQSPNRLHRLFSSFLYRTAMLSNVRRPTRSTNNILRTFLIASLQQRQISMNSIHTLIINHSFRHTANTNQNFFRSRHGILTLRIQALNTNMLNTLRITKRISRMIRLTDNIIRRTRRTTIARIGDRFKSP